MTDMLVKLYELEDDWSFLSEQKEKGIIIRKPIGPEKHLVIDWVKTNFSDSWASEINMSFNGWPVSCWIAADGNDMVGFACYDSTALGFFGPTGVAKNYRNRGIGKALLMACMLDMKLKSYGYAIIGGVGPAQFYEKAVNAIKIPDSKLGIYEHCLKGEGFFDI